jgi:hypothetical protein
MQGQHCLRKQLDSIPRWLRLLGFICGFDDGSDDDVHSIFNKFQAKLWDSRPSIGLGSIQWCMINFLSRIWICSPCADQGQCRICNFGVSARNRCFDKN